MVFSSGAGKYVVFFFYPLDFTFVCPTEIIAFSDAAEEFRKIGCEVIAASVDSHFSHFAWYSQGFVFYSPTMIVWIHGKLPHALFLVYVLKGPTHHVSRAVWVA